MQDKTRQADVIIVEQVALPIAQLGEMDGLTLGIMLYKEHGSM